MLPRFTLVPSLYLVTSLGLEVFLSPGFLLSCPTGLVPETHGLGSHNGNKEPPTQRCPDRHTWKTLPVTQLLQSRSCNNPKARQTGKPVTPKSSHTTFWWAEPPNPPGTPLSHQAGTWILILVFKSLITQRTTTEFLSFSFPVRLGREGQHVGPSSLHDQTHQPFGSWAWSSTHGKWAPKDTWTVVGGRVHRNPLIGQTDTHPTFWQFA